ncbi:MAG: hypothetical protein WAN60_09460 [Candidatus Sulfotelmatobacter sp.]
MNPKRKLRLILLGWVVPFASLLFYVVKSHQLPKWFPFVEFGYFGAFLTYMTLYIRRHPELRSYPKEKAMGVTADSGTARMWTSIFLLAGIAGAVFILLQRDPLSYAWARGVTPNHALIRIVHGAAWVGLAICVAGFVRMSQVWYRTKKAANSSSSARF